MKHQLEHDPRKDAVVASTAAQMEPMEARRMLSAAVYLGVLQIEGTRRADTIAVTLESPHTVSVRVGDQESTFPRRSFGEIRVRAGRGDDRVTLGTDAKPLDVRALILCGDGDDTVAGGAGADTIAGEAGNDQINGGDGDDRLDGGADHDSLAGGAGDDKLLGGSRADDLRGDGGDDSLYGGRGDDTLHEADGIDRIYGNAGTDRFLYRDSRKRFRDGAANEVMSADVTPLPMATYDPTSDTLPSPTFPLTLLPKRLPLHPTSGPFAPPILATYAGGTLAVAPITQLPVTIPPQLVANPGVPLTSPLNPSIPILTPPTASILPTQFTGGGQLTIVGNNHPLFPIITGGGEASLTTTTGATLTISSGNVLGTVISGTTDGAITRVTTFPTITPTGPIFVLNPHPDTTDTGANPNDDGTTDADPTDTDPTVVIDPL